MLALNEALRADLASLLFAVSLPCHRSALV
jgi:hypothetical protein